MAFDDINLIVNSSILLQQQQQQHEQQEQQQQQRYCRNFLLISGIFAFSVGLLFGLFLSLFYLKPINLDNHNNNHNNHHNNHNKSSDGWTVFVNNTNHSYIDVNNNNNNNNNNVNDNEQFNSVSFVNNHNNNNNDNDNDNATILNQYITDDIYWSDLIEAQLPNGYNLNNYKQWSDYINNTNGIKLHIGCGRMQNRLIEFNDGRKGCIRYRQNIDQIQGELFSYYLGQILNLNNLVPTTISQINFNLTIWQHIKHDIQSSQWSLNKPVVITEFINNLDMANIPKLLRPNERHLNKYDIINNINHNNNNNQGTIENLVELAQWSDLIIFDYLTANLDRIVNNLYNYQWNVNIMDAPAHNLAKQSTNNLLIFLDNESGLLHGYRLLKKYEIYHQNLLENLCVFRRPTVRKIEKLQYHRNVGELLLNLFRKYNNQQIQDVLPVLPEKSIKILNQRIDNVYQQIKKCELLFKNAA